MGALADKEEKVEGKPIIVVVDEPVTPENFDIDYEIYAEGFLKFIQNNLDYFKQNGEALGIRTRSLDRLLQVSGRALGMERAGIHMIARWDSPEKWQNHGSEENSILVLHGQVLSLMADKLHKIDPMKYEEFESQALPDARALKYNGKEKIWPLRIEDDQGNVLWSRK